LTCALVGGVLLIAQLVGGALGAEHDTAMHDGAVGSALDGALTHLHQTAHETSGGLQLLSVRALTAAVAFFGIGGLGAISLGAATPLVIIAAALLGAMGMFVVAVTMRAMLCLQRDAKLDIQNSLGKIGAMNVPVPGALGGVGKVTLAVQGRLDGTTLYLGSPQGELWARYDATTPIPSLQVVAATGVWRGWREGRFLQSSGDRCTI
jgi:S-formylglutathione hydrolase FrmB